MPLRIKTIDEVSSQNENIKSSKHIMLDSKKLKQDLW